MENSQAIPTALAGIVVLGIGSQWLATRLKVPSILLLLITGMLAGPITGFINPDELFGKLLLPVVSLSVAVILFEGSMSLRMSQLKEIGRPLFMLLTAGVAITAVICTLAAHWILGFDLQKSLLLGSILTVTGPTVVGRCCNISGQLVESAHSQNGRELSSTPLVRSWPFWSSPARGRCGWQRSKTQR